MKLENKLKKYRYKTKMGQRNENLERIDLKEKNFHSDQFIGIFELRIVNIFIGFFMVTM